MTPPTTLGLIVPLGSDPDLGRAARLAGSGVIDSLWVRDLPVLGSLDPDHGQGSDPWWCLGRLFAEAPNVKEYGTASIILGVRHPWVVARAAMGTQRDTGGRFVLGIGSGGKPAMNAALGIAGRPLPRFADEWRRLREALRTGGGDGVTLHPPSGLRPPPMHLATSDLRRWEAIEGDADGWQTFLTGDIDRFRRDHARVQAISGRPIEVTLRADVEVVAPTHAGNSPYFTAPHRGRIRCTARQLPALVRPWTGDPVRRVLLRLHGHEPESAAHELRSALN
jgi:alkanesulfonate monooxygenase SsuD/methylene tetrahydromethanopterin reductase-like flavin-dependent oxidoreductase (luciferase family)